MVPDHPQPSNALETHGIVIDQFAQEFGLEAFWLQKGLYRCQGRVSGPLDLFLHKRQSPEILSQ